jgi:hypothetical protein
MRAAGKLGGVVFFTVVALTFASVAYGILARRGGEIYGGRALQIEVLNGSGDPGVARRFAEKLLRVGVDVMAVGNADRFDYEETILLSRRGRLDELRELGRRIGCPNVVQQVNEDLFVDGTLVLGRDAESVLNLP